MPTQAAPWHPAHPDCQPQRQGHCCTGRARAGSGADTAGGSRCARAGRRARGSSLPAAAVSPAAVPPAAAAPPAAPVRPGCRTARRGAAPRRGTRCAARRRAVRPPDRHDARRRAVSRADRRGGRSSQPVQRAGHSRKPRRATKSTVQRRLRSPRNPLQRREPSCRTRRGTVVPARRWRSAPAVRRSSSGTEPAMRSSSWRCSWPLRSCSTCRCRRRPDCARRPPDSSRSPTSKKRCAAASSTATTDQLAFTIEARALTFQPAQDPQAAGRGQAEERESPRPAAAIERHRQGGCAPAEQQAGQGHRAEEAARRRDVRLPGPRRRPSHRHRDHHEVSRGRRRAPRPAAVSRRIAGGQHRRRNRLGRSRFARPGGFDGRRAGRHRRLGHLRPRFRRRGDPWQLPQSAPGGQWLDGPAHHRRRHSVLRPAAGAAGQEPVRGPQRLGGRARCQDRRSAGHVQRQHVRPVAGHRASGQQAAGQPGGVLPVRARFGEQDRHRLVGDRVRADQSRRGAAGAGHDQHGRGHRARRMGPRRDALHDDRGVREILQRRHADAGAARRPGALLRHGPQVRAGPAHRCRACRARAPGWCRRSTSGRAAHSPTCLSAKVFR